MKPSPAGHAGRRKAAAASDAAKAFVPPSAWQDRFDGYLEKLASQRKLSPHTTSNYARDLTALAELASRLPALSEPSALTLFHVRRFVAQMHAAGLHPRSIARRLSAWRGFYHWLAEQMPLATNPVVGVKGPKSAKDLPKALSADDAVRLVSQSRTGSDPAAPSALCDRAMFELLYSSGLRVSELTSLDIRFSRENGSVGWVDLDGAEVHVLGKGGKARAVPVGGPALQALRCWLAARPQLVAAGAEAGPSGVALFLTRRGHRMSPREVQKRIKAHAQSIGIPVDVHPHVLRHSFATHVLQSSGDLRAVQEMLGHASISATQVYTALDFQRLAAVYDIAHPRARKPSGT